MFTSKIQRRAHEGNREAFREIFNEYSREVYAYLFSELKDEARSKDSVKQVFLNLFRELMKAESDIDLAERLTALVNEEIKIAKMAGGDFEPMRQEKTVSGGKDPVDTAEDEDDVDEDDDFFDDEEDDDFDDEDDEDEVKPKKKGNAGIVIASVLLVVLVLIFLWLVAGILMDYRILPTVDLGYSWFNTHVFNLFRLPA
ncbi:MAG: hypothetical protein Q4C53_04440 [Clostridia bacterium]|nr:hypothetical protein [Clostridia bacterium]